MVAVLHIIQLQSVQYGRLEFMSTFKNVFVKSKIFLLLVASDEINVFRIAEQTTG